MNIPMWLTLLRILALPIIMLFYLLPFQWAHPAAAILLAVTGITDALDGYLARSWSQSTELGAFLDPVADKLLVAMVLVMVLDSHLIPYLGIPSAVIIGREIAVSALREWMSTIGKRAGVAVTFVAKFKTCIQIVALVGLAWYHPGSNVLVLWLSVILLYIAAILTIWSMCVYLKIAWPHLTISAKS